MHGNREIGNHVDVAWERDEMVGFLQLAEHKTDSTAGNRAAHADKTAHEHEHAHDARFAEAHAA